MGIENRDDVTATYVLIHGAGADSWCWHRVRPLLEAAGHTVITPDLPVSDDTAGLPEYVDTVRRAVGSREHVTVVAHSFGGFVGPIAAEQLGADLLVLLHAMIPKPGEAPGQWWSATGHEQARRRDDELHGPAAGDVEFWAHDTPPVLAAEAMRRGIPQSVTPFTEPWPMDHWPQTPTRVLLSRGDRFLPAEFLETVTTDRLGIAADTMPGDHLPMLGHPECLVERLETYRRAPGVVPRLTFPTVHR
ncbi:alpha/beta fold hydrolase [Prescottella agglutinans]|uniref:Pimeloyl-ACP methyl ester carboxylesterase n=1 Tax=Prescottella agglutinans TaxID=1644129 RepID=A0ABT6MJ68_9NOCA|nr:alpha/beta hydrolase [Prescottella agglutinans]MDH6284371.1 pimeloyl-ACP methyl ester carboxylesterase [Prescottella agglutinans]